MLSVAGFSLFTPWALVGFAVLPVIWWLVRLTPPQPRRVVFPAIRLLAGLQPAQPSASSFPWWLLVLRLVMASLLIIGAASPVYNPQAAMRANGPLLLIIDDGWSAAPNWALRIAHAEDLLTQAERQGRGVVLISTAPERAVKQQHLMSPSQARTQIHALQPKPWQSDRSRVLAAVADPLLSLKTAGRIVWLSDGVASGHTVDAGTPVQDVLSVLRRIGPVTLVTPAPGTHARVVFPPHAEADQLITPVRRIGAEYAEATTLIAYDGAGRAVGRAMAHFDVGDRVAKARFDLPVEIRNRIERIVLDDEDSAGGVVLIDERWRRRPVGLVGGDTLSDAQPFLSAHYYLERALSPLHELRNGTMDELLDRELAALMLADPAPLDASQQVRVGEWVDRGGVLVTFAGPRLAASAGVVDDAGAASGLLPVALRAGGRAIGGAMSWRKPAALAAFDTDSPFFGLSVADDVRIYQQVLAQPSPDLAGKTWARLADGTPLVSATPRGEGWLVLFHVSANASWSSLPLSGLFVEMLQRVVRMSRGVSGALAANRVGLLEPNRTLDGFGRLGAAPKSAISIPADELALLTASPDHPPGFYGSGRAQSAFNLSAAMTTFDEIGTLPGGIARETYHEGNERVLAPWLFGFVLILFALDMALSMWLRGHRFTVFGFKTSASKVALGMLAVVLMASGAQAQDTVGTDDEARAISAANLTRLAYVRSGDPRIDDISALGLAGLGAILAQRSAVELGPPQGIDPEIDELVFYPMIYWPITADSAVPSARAAQRINAFLANGGTVLFDTREPGDPAGMRQLRNFAKVLDIPRLIPVPANHVLGRAFYLLNEFPGRWSGAAVWVVPAEERVNDGVSPIVVGSHDWAAAWAMDENREPLYAVVPGGERQREFAFRFGVNLVMYVLTGNYKGDQVHLPAIMDRLGP